MILILKWRRDSDRQTDRWVCGGDHQFQWKWWLELYSCTPMHVKVFSEVSKDTYIHFQENLIFFPVTFDTIRGLWSSKVLPRPFAGVSLLGYLGCGLLCSANTSSIYFLHPFLLYKMCCSAIAISGSILFVLKGLHSFIILLLTTLVRAQQEEYAHSEHPKQRGFNARN